MISYSNKTPEEIVVRFLAIDKIHEMGVDIARTYNENLVLSYDEEDEEGVIQTKYEFDWEYILFTAPLFQMTKVLDAVMREAEEEKKKKTSSILDINGNNIIKQ
jgi:hypothetical protein